ncbi:unnamed protein product [Lepeophtheirus salmonis]|uniref:(salmon louse) hypothetical protein n=1 Tax=Lepeophtheirus salmonis TaxID=72036 RepID=A0A7R8CED7_LEPSM|nr:unnamed protein product [Lepeophtheirus salmonis]CAF2794493.1 unnamed protein product [Lepeophtheirus salmonis]
MRITRAQKSDKIKNQRLEKDKQLILETSVPVSDETINQRLEEEKQCQLHSQTCASDSDENSNQSLEDDKHFHSQTSDQESHFPPTKLQTIKNQSQPAVLLNDKNLNMFMKGLLDSMKPCNRDGSFYIPLLGLEINLSLRHLRGGITLNCFEDDNILNLVSHVLT